MDGRSYEARVEPNRPTAPGGVDRRHRFEIEVRDPRRWSRKTAGQRRGRRADHRRPMPGKVVRVLVAAGDAVDAGQGLVVVEAMKMQNELKSDRAGKVLTLSAKEGNTVTAGEVLATVG